MPIDCICFRTVTVDIYQKTVEQVEEPNPCFRTVTVDIYHYLIRPTSYTVIGFRTVTVDIYQAGYIDT